MLYKGSPFIHGWMKYVVIIGMLTNFQLCKLTLFQVVFNYNSNFGFPTNTLPPLLYVIFINIIWHIESFINYGIIYII
jgi:hypothetical protein